MKGNKLAVALLFALAPLVCQGSGFLIPSGPNVDVPPLAIKYQRVNTDIREQVAETRVEQVFTNSTDRQLEATYVFPLPEGAAIGEFAMMVNGQRVTAELMEKKEAARIYEEIVRRMRDPGLLEHMGGNLFRARVFPILPKSDQRIEISYSEVIPYDSGLYRYSYPLRTGEKASGTLEDFTLTVRLYSSQDIRSVYSPTHEVGIGRPSDREAVVGFEETRATLDRDFTLFYTVSEEKVGLNLLAQRKEGEDGYFLILIAPQVEVVETELISRDITFVVDVSGSMAQDDKMGQAKEAVKHCLRSLPERDRFNIIRFSTAVDSFRSEPVPATRENVEAGLAYVEAMRATGGTAISEALQRALGQKRESHRPHTVLFLTDGRPTVGQTDVTKIVGNVRDGNREAHSRIFVFGVGNDVNAHLLDMVADQNGGLTEYVSPREEIEEKVSGLYNKMSKPVLADLSMDFGSAEVYDIYPQTLPDLFAGSQVRVFGRYRGNEEHTAIRLKGKVNEKEMEFVYEGTFPKIRSDHSFIPKLWGARKIGYLLDQIRLQGEDPELRQAVVDLSTEFGIITPYTSFLITEETAQRVAGRPGEPPVNGRRMEPGAFMGHGVPIMEDEARERTSRGRGAFSAIEYDGKSGTVSHGDVVRLEPDGGRLPAPTDSMTGKERSLESLGYMEGAASGDRAILYSRALRSLKESEEVRADLLGIRRVKDKNFRLIDGVWVDSEYTSEDENAIRIVFGSQAYFALLRAEPKLAEYFSLGENVIVRYRGKTLIVSDKGRETVSEEEIASLFDGF